MPVPVRPQTTNRSMCPTCGWKRMEKDGKGLKSGMLNPTCFFAAYMKLKEIPFLEHKNKLISEIAYHIYIYMYQLEPHKAVAEVSK